MYVAFDINTHDTWARLKVEHPSTLDRTAMSDEMLNTVPAEDKGGLMPHNDHRECINAGS